MKMSRLPVRLSIRRAMVAVAVVAVCLAGIATVMRRREEFRRLSREYGRKSVEEMLLGQNAAYSTTFGPSAEDLRTLRAHEGLSDYYARLQSKYERSAMRPWRP